MLPETVGVRQLKHETSEVLGRIERDGGPIMITNRGRIVAVIRSLTDEERDYYAMVADRRIVPGDAGGPGAAGRLTQQRSAQPAATSVDSATIDDALEESRADRE